MATTGARGDWTDGYVADIAYTDGYYAGLAPVHLAYVAMLNRCAPPRIDRPFTYCELGCGNGHTVSVLAAAYPDSQFYACDFNPAHVAKARRWAESAGLKNLTILEASFQEMVAMDLPPFDFITFHGIYSWISESNRKAILDVLARHLQPGGLVYNSYNCLPGWASQSPMQRMMLEIARDIPGDSLAKAAGAMEFLKVLTESDCAYFQAEPAAVGSINKLGTHAPSYVAHEYLNEEWHPMYCVDVFREMRTAKMAYVGSSMIPENHPKLIFGKSALEIYEAQPTSDRRQLVKDFLLNQRFRCDVYMKGCSALSPHESRIGLRDLVVGLIKPADRVNYTAKYRAGTLKFDHARSRSIIAALRNGAMTVGELAAQPGLSNMPEQRLQAAVHTLISAGQIIPFAKPSLPLANPTGQFAVPSPLNRYVLQTTLEPGARGVLASEITGRGISLDRNERCFTQALVSGHGAKTPDVVLKRLERAGIRVKVGEEFVASREAALAELQKQFASYDRETLPLLQRVGILAPR